jgi:hypothetical protein
MAKVVPIRSGTPEDAIRRAKLDEFGEIKRRLALSEPDEQRLETLKAEIESWFEDSPPELPIVVRGDRWEVQLSPRRNERTIVDQRKLFNILRKTLGLDGVIATFNLPLGAIDKHVPKSAQAGLVTEERSGYRTLKPVAIAPAEMPKAA